MGLFMKMRIGVSLRRARLPAVQLDRVMQFSAALLVCERGHLQDC